MERLQSTVEAAQAGLSPSPATMKLAEYDDANIYLALRAGEASGCRVGAIDTSQWIWTVRRRHTARPHLVPEIIRGGFGFLRSRP
ncbi:hypothetical protein [Streptomyces sp. SM11]|uniref:hypothetical protein n=1 Tax=Streptomyces sp. SM11 TaxID=565557 RepID=UPI000CD59736|nr:hypothetical protein [Streptomyces sp. SM11]